MIRRFLPVAALALSAGCGSSGEPVARVVVEPSSLVLGYGEVRSLRLDWKALGPLEKRHGKPKVFLHLLERPGKVARTFDHPLPEDWAPGRAQAYEIPLYQSALGPALPAGKYTLSLGLYDDSWGYRWALDAGPDIGKREYAVATVVVPPSEASKFRFELAGDWEPTRPGSDQQILARRWLRGDGTIRVRGPEGIRGVRLLLHVPSERGMGDILVSESCEPALRRRLSPGNSWVRVARAEPAKPCEIRLQRASPTPAPPENARALCVNVLGWSAEDR